MTLNLQLENFYSLTSIQIQVCHQLQTNFVIAKQSLFVNGTHIVLYLVSIDLSLNIFNNKEWLSSGFCVNISSIRVTLIMKGSWKDGRIDRLIKQSDLIGYGGKQIIISFLLMRYRTLKTLHLIYSKAWLNIQ